MSLRRRSGGMISETDGHLSVSVVRAQGLRRTQFIKNHVWAAPDAFAELVLNTSPCALATDTKKAFNPVWNQSSSFELNSVVGNHALSLEYYVYHKRVHKDELLGKGTINLSQEVLRSALRRWQWRWLPLALTDDGPQVGRVRIGYRWSPHATLFGCLLEQWQSGSSCRVVGFSMLWLSACFALAAAFSKWDAVENITGAKTFAILTFAAAQIAGLLQMLAVFGVFGKHFDCGFPGFSMDADDSPETCREDDFDENEDVGFKASPGVKLAMHLFGRVTSAILLGRLTSLQVRVLRIISWLQQMSVFALGIMALLLSLARRQSNGFLDGPVLILCSMGLNIISIVSFQRASLIEKEAAGVAAQARHMPEHSLLTQRENSSALLARSTTLHLPFDQGAEFGCGCFHLFGRPSKVKARNSSSSLFLEEVSNSKN